MPDAATPRRILQDLPVNAYGTPNVATLPDNLGLKRPVAEVEDRTAAPIATRLRISDRDEPAYTKVTVDPYHQWSSH